MFLVVQKVIKYGKVCMIYRVHSVLGERLDLECKFFEKGFQKIRTLGVGATNLVS